MNVIQAKINLVKMNNKITRKHLLARMPYKTNPMNYERIFYENKL